ncbi:blood group Rh(CE) polypeptide isoform X1 [Vidua macroura]|uniref:blood group Rh(CE) polypeptide isoform X1 n=2 Tax=Vidua macroura TaxID=187451 RepID=UPI0023A80389|nr:blood group Rh(CE) polypeptide isoform X1 [Vidua macroura]XP_053854479.1 blood group Rh(CE) polypeptide isoform X1 [Vidua macroura]XP_053854480.1 blood group Rh(CE) polypeptide isoform X1 [Vidua macroura]
MPARYLSFRCSVPWLILLLQALFLTRSFFGFPGVSDSYGLSNSYPEFQDVTHMVIFGFGFFLMVLRRYGFSSTGFNFLLVVLGVQCSMLAEDLLVFIRGKQNQVGMKSLAKAVVSTTAVVISTGAVLGKANPVQLIVMTLVELIFFHVSRCINSTFLKVPEHLTVMHVHLFGAYFGLALTSRFPEPPPGLDKNRSTPKSELFSVLGTVFVWVFWPSFNSILSESKEAVLNTYLALAVSAVAAFMLSALTSKDGKFRMAHIRSAALAGGVAVSYTAHRIQHPWIAMILGLLGSVITILGSHCLQRCFNPALKLQDTSGVHFTFGLPAVLGAVAAVVLCVVEDGIETQWNELSSLGYIAFYYIGAFCQTISTALITGLITGLILNIKLLKAVHVSKYFDDQFYWEFPHLSVGF